MGLSTGCEYPQHVSWLPSNQVIQDVGQFENRSVLHDGASEVTHSLFHDILLVTQVGSIQYRSRLYKDVKTRKWGSLWAIWEAGYHSEVTRGCY